MTHRPEQTDRPEPTHRPEQTRQWWVEGEALLGRAVGGLPDAALAGASLLPGWSRHVLLAHLARNADALVNLLTWAETGVETPMYASADARDAGITATARLAPAALREDYTQSVTRLARAAAELPAAAWDAPVRTAQGRTVAAAEVPWMRCREVWVHAVDLDAGVTFADLPADVCAALLDDVFAMWARRAESPDLAAVATDADRRWGSGAVTASGEVAALTGWLTGRGPANRLSFDGPVPGLPAWL